MKPGKELDILIAEKIFGQIKPYSNQFAQMGHRLKPYSTSIEAAWEVVDRCRKEFGRFGFWHKDSGVSLFHWMDGRLDPEEELAFGETPAHAICLAALKLNETSFE